MAKGKAKPALLRKKAKPRKTTRSSNRKRAAQAGMADRVRGGPRKPRPHVIDPDSESEVYGAALSERRRMGESIPTLPEGKTKNTRSKEPKSVPLTGIAKQRKR